MKDPGSYANPVNSSFQKFRTTRAMMMAVAGLLVMDMVGSSPCR